MNKKALMIALAFLLLTGIVMAKEVNIAIDFVGRLLVPERADVGILNVKEEFEWFTVESFQETVPIEFIWINGTNLDRVDTWLITPDGRRLNLPFDYVDRVVIKSSEIGNYTFYGRGLEVTDVKGYLRVKCDFCIIGLEEVE